MVKKRLTYKVQRGDDYTKIADRLYSDKRYQTALMRQNPHVKKVSPGVVINLLDDDPKEMWKKRERGRRRQASLRKKNWENFKRALGINPDLSEIEPTPITIQPPAPPEPTTWWEDPAFQEGLIGLVESTAESMGLDANVMLEELGLGEGSPLLAEAPPTGQAQPQTGSPPSTPPMTDEQKKALKKELGEMGLDADVAMYELGLSDRDPYAWVTPQVPLQSSETTGGKTTSDVKSISGNKVLKLILPEVPIQTSLTNEQIAKLKEDLEKMGLDVELAMYELGLSDYDPYRRYISAEPSPPSIDPIISNFNQTYPDIELASTFDNQERILIADVINTFADFFGGPDKFMSYTGVNELGRLSNVKSKKDAWYNMRTPGDCYINIAPNLLNGVPSLDCCQQPLDITDPAVGYSQDVKNYLEKIYGEKTQEVIYKWFFGHEIAESLLITMGETEENHPIIDSLINKYGKFENEITKRQKETSEYSTYRQIFCDALSAYLFFPELTSDYDRFFDFNLPPSFHNFLNQLQSLR